MFRINNYEKRNPDFDKALDTLREILSGGGLDERLKNQLQQVAEQMSKGAKALEKSLTEAEIFAKQAIQSKSDFLSRISHEIRTPINAISGMAHIAQGTKDMGRVKECLETISDASAQLISIVNDMLDTSSIEAGTVGLIMEPFTFESALMSAVGRVSVRTEEKRQKLYCNIDVGMPARFMGDGQRVAQVIYNLLSNASKFTPEGGSISVTAKQVAREGDQSTIQVAVSDNGIGISESEQGKLFQAFYQSDGSSARQFGGTGLGLTIVKQLVEMMRGTIEVKSEVDRGSTFTFTIELTALEESPLLEEKAGMSDINVLIADPDAETCEYFRQIMDTFKVRSHCASCVEEALHLVEQGRKSGEMISILFLDWSLAEKDGADLARTLKHQYSVSTVMMLPAAKMSDGMMSGAGEAEMSYIAKPLLPSSLLRSIYEVVGAPAEQAPRSKAPYCAFSGYRVLLVEDMEINRRVFDQILSETQVAVSYAENGDIAVEMFQRNPDLYDIILMDVHMPVMDGYEATRMIRNLPHPKGATVPIVAITANAFAADIERSFQAGMNGHLTKPIEVDKLFKIMQELLKPKDQLQKNAPEADGSDAGEVERAVAAAEALLRQNPYIDYDSALQKVRGSMRVLKILLQSFVSNHQLDQLIAETEAHDYEIAARTASAIKGACTNLSLNPLKEKLEELEMQLQSRFHIDETLQELKGLFEATLEGVNDALKAMHQIAKD